MTAAKLNILADNLRYLKGTDGAVQIDNDLAVVSASAPALTVQGTANGSLARLSLIAKTAGAAAVEYRYMVNALGLGEWIVYDNVASATRVYLTSSGNFGIGATAPQGKLHVKGAGGGFLYLSANAVDGTLQTLAAAGTVTSGAVFYIIDRNNTTGTNYLATTGVIVALAGTITYVNTDTLVVTLTAGGGITVQRTVGTNGTHQVNALCLYY